MDQPKSFLTPSVAIIIGSIVISLAILVGTGTISLQNNVKGAKTTAVTTTPAPVVTNTESQPKTLTLNQVKDAFSKAQIKFGDTNKKLIVIEVSDPSCPYCQIAAGKNSDLNKQAGSRFTLVADGGTYLAPVPEIEKLVSSGKAAFAWIYYPGHGAGEMGTKAMYCAFEQGKFWQAHDLIMSAKGYDLLNNTIKNDQTKSGDLAAFLSSAIDQNTLKTCLDGGKYDNRLKDDMALAQTLGIQGTPGFFINTTNFAGAYDFKDMEPAVNAALNGN